MRNYVVGLDIGGTRTKIGLVDTQELKVLDARIFPTEKKEKERFFGGIREALSELCGKNQIPPEAVAGIGAGIGSYIFREGGTVDSTWGYIPCLDRVALADELRARLGKSCMVDNDLRAIALAESSVGAGAGSSRVLNVTLGTGVGVCLTVDGAFTDQEAYTHLAGHIKVRDRDEWVEALDRERCYCSVSGCMENTCSATSLRKMAGQMVRPGIGNEELFALAGEGDEGARTCLAFFFDCLLRGLNQMVYIFSPDKIVLGGGITKAFRPYLGRLQQGLTARVNSRQEPELAISDLEENSGILGAALLWVGQYKGMDNSLLW